MGSEERAESEQARPESEEARALPEHSVPPEVVLEWVRQHRREPLELPVWLEPPGPPGERWVPVEQVQPGHLVLGRSGRWALVQECSLPVEPAPLVPLPADPLPEHPSPSRTADSPEPT
jgi:hypothetical protein